MNPENVDAIKNRLIPIATVVTPNLFEAGQLAELGLLTDLDDMKKAAKIIHEKGAKIVVVKGGKALPEMTQSISCMMAMTTLF